MKFEVKGEAIDKMAKKVLFRYFGGVKPGSHTPPKSVAVTCSNLSQSMHSICNSNEGTKNT